MSHCALEATLKPIPKTVIGNLFVTQVCWEAVPNTWPGSSEASVAKWNSTQSVWMSGADVLDLPKPSVCCQPNTEVPGQTKTRK